MRPVDLLPDRNCCRVSLDNVCRCRHALESSCLAAMYRSLLQVGTISANGEAEIGELIARAMERVGKEGVITVQVGLDFNWPLSGSPE